MIFNGYIADHVGQREAHSQALGFLSPTGDKRAEDSFPSVGVRRNLPQEAA